MTAPESEIVAIVGYRNYPLLSRVVDYVNELPAGVTVISGWNEDPAENNDVDKIAIIAARLRGLTTRCFPADWRLGKRGGPLRNSQIVACGTRIVAFDHPDAVGTKDTIAKARAAHKSVLIFNEHGQPQGESM